MKNLLKNIRFFKKMLNRKPFNHESSVNAENDEKSYKQEIERINRRLEDIIGLSQDDSTLIKSINGHIDVHAEIYGSIGYAHGKKGTRDYSIMKTAIAQATQITEHINATLKGRTKGIESVMEEKKLSLDELNKNAHQNTYELREKTTLQNNDFKQFDGWMAFIYIVFGIAMILADIAVSVNLVGYFGIGNIRENASFLDKISDPELILFSLGVAFCTIYVKILYDEYINAKLGYRQQEILDATDNGLNKSTLQWESNIKMGIKILILFGLLYLLYYLAKYRTFFTMGDINLPIPHTLADPGFTEVQSIMLRCFLGISVVVPVISGISLSMGLKILAQKKTLSNARVYEKELKENLDENEAEVKEMTSRLTQFEFHIQEWSKMSHKIDIISGLFAQRYNQGFREGYRENFDNDMYNIVEEYRNEYINKIMSKHLQ